MSELLTNQLEGIKPGVELDAIISKEIFGQCPHNAVSPFSLPCTENFDCICFNCADRICPNCDAVIVDYCGDYDNGTVKYIDERDWSCPDYSTDLNNMQFIVDKVLEGQEGYFTLLIIRPNKQYQAMFCTLAKDASYKADTAAEALCKAALAFIRKE